MIKVDLITGFLGAGKTTFIKEYAQYLVGKGQKVAIIVNDYGAINVDRLLLGDSLSDSCHLEMVIGGDADCTRRRLKTKLISVAMAGYNHVIVEPSGIFDVDEFYDMLYEEPLERWYEMANVITLVEYENGSGMPDEARYILVSQVAKAGQIIVSKADRMDTGEAGDEKKKKEAIISYLNEGLEEYGCSRRIKDVYIWHQGAVSDEDFEMISRSGHYSGEMKRLPQDKTGRFESAFFFHVGVKREELETVVKQLFEDASMGRIIRLKGFFKTNERDKAEKESTGDWLEINATKKEISINPISAGQELFIIIGEDLNREKIHTILGSDEKI